MKLGSFDLLVRALDSVLNFWCDRHRDTPVDVFVTEPFNFDEEYGRALVKLLGSVAGGD
jgi:hypothetical protein